MNTNRSNIAMLLLLGMAFLVSCVSTYETNAESAYQIKLNVDDRLVIATPDDGYYGTITYTNSGRTVTDVIYRTFSGYAPNTDRLESTKYFRDYTGTNADVDYFIEPKILHWEDRNTEWSGKPDRIHIQVTIYNIASGAVVSEFDFTGKSKWATFGGDHPQDLLVDPLSEYAENLFRNTH